MGVKLVGEKSMRYRRICCVVACIGLCSSLLVPTSGIAAPGQNNNRNNKSNNKANNPANQVYGQDNNQVNQAYNQPAGQQQKKSTDDYQKHVKDAEKANKQQQRQYQNAVFKSNVRHAIEHGHAHH